MQFNIHHPVQSRRRFAATFPSHRSGHSTGAILADERSGLERWPGLLAAGVEKERKIDMYIQIDYYVFTRQEAKIWQLQ
jgi:hypothetical protein